MGVVVANIPEPLAKRVDTDGSITRAENLPGIREKGVLVGADLEAGETFKDSTKTQSRTM